MTSIRSQGRTIDHVYVLASSADARRDLYVDVSRARESVTIVYGRDELADFGALLDIGARERSKQTVTGLLRNLNLTMVGEGGSSDEETINEEPDETERLDFDSSELEGR